MGNLANLFRRSGIFKKEFDFIFPAKNFNQDNLRDYVAFCTNLVREEAQRLFSHYGLKFFEPVFIFNGEVVPNFDSEASALAYDPDGLIFSNVIVPLSLPVIANDLAGICLFSGRAQEACQYNAFKSFNLDNIRTRIDPMYDLLDESYLVREINDLKFNPDQLPAGVLEFARTLRMTGTEEITRLVKTLVLYKYRADKAVIPEFFTTINRYHPRPSFFDILFTTVSEQPFTEDELLDFALVIESMSLPILNYHDQRNNDAISGNSKRAVFLQEQLRNKVWSKTWVNGKRVDK